MYSLAPQRFHGINARGRARGDVAGYKRYAKQQDSDQAKRNGIGWRGSKEQAGQDSGQCKRAGHVHDETYHGEGKALDKNQVKDVAPRRAHRHSDIAWPPPCRHKRAIDPALS